MYARLHVVQRTEHVRERVVRTVAGDHPHPTSYRPLSAVRLAENNVSLDESLVDMLTTSGIDIHETR